MLQTLREVKEKCLVLSDNYRNALAAESEEIMYSFPGDVAIYYDDNGMCRPVIFTPPEVSAPLSHRLVEVFFKGLIWLIRTR